MEALFDERQMAEAMVHAFVRRAHLIYGRPRSQARSGADRPSRF
jgi:hypothetical protein